ncbi:ABC transporter permease [Gardnerella swidsinskii]|uniref:ABC transporter permease n=1 Tax=Gardnerella swidsinskii TaxID=2792979 RepID=UPI000C9C20DE|nr:ABC transporter permease [Gardnerella swidsinskii]MDK6295359.1 ABC transporter permease [Gardnerella swidsinskii]MDK8691769.1 ABC transporter permease [Gardnerella swidsinskii]PMC44699.1 peptide ABC transporter permease [Gardnerella vaginalis]RFT34008.1 peptide ABC transporter permease [Bifidobacteriaceae bacterium NR020]
MRYKENISNSDTKNSNSSTKNISNKQNVNNTQKKNMQQNISNNSNNESAKNSRIISKTVDFLTFLIKRSASAVLVLTLIAVVLFLIFFMLPANPAQLACGKPCTPERLARVSAFMGTDAPWYEQLGNYIRGIFFGREFGTNSASSGISAAGAAIICSSPCLGWSFTLNEPVTDLIMSRFAVTASLAIGAALLWVIIGVVTGVISASKEGSLFDRAFRALSSVGISSPAYLIGMLAILAFAVYLPIFPTGGYVNFLDDPLGWLQHLLLPWIVLALLNAAYYTRLTRAHMLDELQQDYMRTALAKGMPRTKVITRHALPNVMLPVLTMFGLDLGGLLGGAVITERVFSMQGLGSLLLDSVKNLDLQVLVGVTLFAAAFVIVANLIVDICYRFIDPRAAVC